MALPVTSAEPTAREISERLSAIIRNIYNQMIPVGPANSTLVSDGETLTWATLRLKVTKFAASGTFTPDAKCMSGFAVGIGAGGGSIANTSGAGDARGNGGGAEGNTVTKFFVKADVSPNVSVTIGAGAAGSAGGDTTFGSLLTAKGGGVGSFPPGGSPTAAGNVGDIVRLGAPGGSGAYFPNTGFGTGGSGGGCGGGIGGSAPGGSGANGAAGAANSGGGAGGGGCNGGASNSAIAGGSGYLYAVEFLLS